MNRYNYIREFPQWVQNEIVEKITAELFYYEGIAENSIEQYEAINSVLDSRLVDLQEIIEINEYL